jgi:putative RecB family exonuclease
MVGPAVDEQLLMLPGMPERLVSATPTRLTGWVACPRRYRFTYLERPQPRRGAPWAHTSVGSAVHTALARWWREPLALRTPGRAAALLAGAWVDEGFRDRAQESAARQRTIGDVTRYTAALDPTVEPVGVERTVGTRTATLALSGRVDRIDERSVPARPRGDARTVGDTELVVVDYKTGRRPPVPGDARSSLALAIYALAVARTLRRVCRRVELHHLPTGAVVEHTHTEQSLARHADRADEIGRELRGATASWSTGLNPAAVEAVFPPRPGPSCAWCDFRVSCPEGARASPTIPPWAGIDDDVPD